MPEFSIVITTYNSEEVVATALRSAISQAFSDIEIIVVDDASEDGTLEIVERFSEEDDRIRVIKHPVNTKAAQSRIDGALSAMGRYVLFLDSDDSLDENACSILHREMVDSPCEILHFESEAVCHQKSESKQYVDAWLKPFFGNLFGGEILSGCFLDGLYHFTIWNKLFSVDLCKRSLENVAMRDVPRANDAALYFVLASCARSYRGAQTGSLVTYNYGLGEGGKTRFDLEQFNKLCQSSKAADVIESYIKNRSTAETDCQLIRRCASAMRKALAESCACEWRDSLSRCDKEEGLQCLFEAWKESSLSALRAACEDDMVCLCDVGKSFKKSINDHGRHAGKPMVIIEESFQALTEDDHVLSSGNEEPSFLSCMQQALGEDCYTLITISPIANLELEEAAKKAITNDCEFVVYIGSSSTNLFLLAIYLQYRGVPVITYIDRSYKRLLAASFEDAAELPIALQQCNSVFVTEDTFDVWRRFNSCVICVDNQAPETPALQSSLYCGEVSHEEELKDQALSIAAVAESYKSAYRDISNQRDELLSVMAKDDEYRSWLQKDIDRLSDEVQAYDQRLQETMRKKERLENKVHKKEQRIKDLKAELTAMKESNSWRIGRTITWLPRRIKGEKH